MGPPAQSPAPSQSPHSPYPPNPTPPAQQAPAQQQQQQQPRTFQRWKLKRPTQQDAHGREHARLLRLSGYIINVIAIIERHVYILSHCSKRSPLVDKQPDHNNNKRQRIIAFILLLTLSHSIQWQRKRFRIQSRRWWYKRNRTHARWWESHEYGRSSSIVWRLATARSIWTVPSPPMLLPLLAYNS